MRWTYDGNKLWQSLSPSYQVLRTFSYDSAGALRQSGPSDPDGNWRWYFQNPLGEVSGYLEQMGNQYYHWFIGDGNMCRYDAVGRRVLPCGGGAWLGFDGDNVVRENGTWLRWRYVQGPGVDDPLVSIYRQSCDSPYDRFYYLTYGQGRLLAFTDSLGQDRSGWGTYTDFGGNQAGAVSQPNSFANARAESPNAPRLSFYRNRYYDQETGRWNPDLLT